MFKGSKRNLVLSIVIAVLLIGGGVWAAVAYQAGQTAATTETETLQAEPPIRNRTEISYTAEAGVTSLEQLQDEADNVVVKSSEYGDYVDAIEGHTGGIDGYYWSFYVDGKMSDVGAGSYTQKGGEEIVWKYQKL